jgi:hypothetical protein
MRALIKRKLYRKPRTKTPVKEQLCAHKVYYMDQNVRLYSRQVHSRSNRNVTPKGHQWLLDSN